MTKTLKHNDLVRLAGWSRVTTARIGTVEGLGGSVELAVSRGHDIAFVTYAGAALSASPAYYAQKVAEAASATTLSDGEIVEVEGRRYTVTVLKGCAERPCCSDPIHLKAA